MRARTSALLLVALAALASTARATDATPAADASAQRRRLQTIGQHNTHISSGTGTHVGDMVHRLRDVHEDNVQKIEDAARAAQASVQAAHDANMKEIADTTAKLTNAHDETRDRTLALMNSAEERFSAAMTAAIAALANAAEAWRDHLRQSSARYKARVEAFQDGQVERLGKLAGVAAGMNAYGKQKVDEAYDAHRQRVADMVSEIGDHLGDTADKLTSSGRRLLEDHDDEESDRRDRDWPNFRMNREPFERVRKGWSEFGKHRRDRWKKHRQPVSSGTGTLIGDAIANARKNNRHQPVSSGTGTLIGDAIHNARKNARSKEDDE